MADSDVDSIGAQLPPKRVVITGFETAAKKAGYMNWNDDSNYMLMKYAKKHMAYVISDVKMEIKWSCVKKNLLAKNPEMFEPIADQNWKSLQTAFNRAKDEVLERCGISKEGANLSGKEKSCPSEYESFVIEIDKVMNKKKRKREAKQKIDHEEEVLLNGIAGEALSKQGKQTPASKKATTTKLAASKSTPSDMSETGSEKPSLPLTANSFLSNMREDIQRLMGDGGAEKKEADEREAALRRELLQEQIEDARISKQLKLKQLEKLNEM